MTVENVCYVDMMWKKDKSCGCENQFHTDWVKVGKGFSTREDLRGFDSFGSWTKSNH